ncbi:TlpA family protein disulfide reductase [Salimicrobium flavidum]|uniref:Thiol-disulfide isomerase or thioredoxin n=1 Tax=Salimicrobium flavidum TaxID=570947 RepID=A0A1N7IK28_9BACI|nr:TlpA disulfide reductase family protein [Salimicrobium flavidum]SIS37356.1 Thiol-disulfide isomerase or thioredoxin [Salimicrobium flavidum]
MKKLTTLIIASFLIALVLYSVVEYTNGAEESGGEYNVSGDTDQEGTAIVPPEADEGIEIGEQAPNIPLQTLQGKKTNVDHYKGKPVILNIWATWCPPCKEEMPGVQRFHEKYGEDVTVLAVNATSTEEDPSNVSRYIQKEGFTFETLLDKEDQLSEKYQTFTIPATYFINSDGTIHSRKFGPMTYEFMTDKMKKLD